VPLGRGELAKGRQRRVGDLISYQNDGQSCTAIDGKVERAGEYSSPCIDMRADDALLSA
jgi:hypothetical protein